MPFATTASIFATPREREREGYASRYRKKREERESLVKGGFRVNLSTTSKGSGIDTTRDLSEKDLKVQDEQ